MYERLTYKEFEKLAAVTEYPLFHTDKLKVSTLHGMLGIQTEVNELFLCIRGSFLNNQAINKANLLEELGDILWYMSAISRSEGWYMHVDPAKKMEQSYIKVVSDMMILAGNLTDYIKKSLFYGIEIDTLRIRNNVDGIHHYIHNLCSIFNCDIEVIMAQNINKLKQRYPEQFTSEHSVLRLDKLNGVQ